VPPHDAAQIASSDAHVIDSSVVVSSRLSKSLYPRSGFVNQILQAFRILD